MPPFLRHRGGGPRPPRSPDALAARQLAAVLTWRTRLLLRTVSPAAARAIRFLPAALQTSFPYPGLRDEAPGVEGVLVGRRWSALAASLGLPPPVAPRRGRRAVSALLVTIGDDGVIGWAVPAENAGPEERRRLHARVERMNQVLAGQLALVVLDAAHPGAVPRLAAFGGLVAGRVPPSFWPPAVAAGQLDLEAACRLAVDAPTPLAALAVAFLAGRAGPHPVTALREALGTGISARALADPELFAALWAGNGTGRHDDLLRVIELASHRQTSRRVASTLRNPSGPSWRREPRTAARTLALGRGLALAAIAAASHAPASCRAPLRNRLRREAIEPGVPSFLLPAIGKALVAAGLATPEELPPPVRVGRAYVVEDGAGGVLARGCSPAQARLRATALVARALAARTGTGSRASPDARWADAAGSGSGPAAGTDKARERFVRRSLAAALVQPPARRSLLLRIEAADVPGPPFDPLNRGPHRRLGFGPSDVTVLRAGYRPTARKLAPETIVPLLFAEARAGTAVEVAAVTGAAEPAAARLERLVRWATGPREHRLPPAVEAGGRIYLLEERIRTFAAGRFAARPLACAPDPESPDLGVGGPAPNSGVASRPRDRIECRVSLAGPERAALLYEDEHGWVLREVIPLAGLEDWIRETQELLRAPPRPTALALRVGPGVEAAAGRHRGPAELEVPVRVSGSLPFGLVVDISGERFGGDLPLGWRAAALTALSGWPPGAKGKLRVRDVSVSIRGRPPGGLFRLYARSLALRRLERHLGTQLRLKDRGERVESMGNAEFGARW